MNIRKDEEAALIFEESKASLTAALLKEFGSERNPHDIEKMIKNDDYDSTPEVVPKNLLEIYRDS